MLAEAYLYRKSEAAKQISYVEKIKLSLSTLKNRILIVIVPLLLIIPSWGAVFAADYLISSHIYLSLSVKCIWVVLINYCRFCQRPLCIELLGILFTIAAVISMYADPTAMRVDGNTGEAWVYAVCIACSISSSLWILINNELLKTLPIFANLLIQSVLMYLYSIIFCFALVEDYSFFSTSM